MARESEINLPPPSAAHQEGTGRPPSSLGLPTISQPPAPSLSSSPWAEGGPRHPTLWDPTHAPASLPAHGVRAPLLAARLVIILLPPSLPSPQAPRAPLAGVPTRCPLLQGLRPDPPPRPAAATAAHRASPIWSAALTSHGCLVRHPPPHLQDTSWRRGRVGAQGGFCGQERRVGVDGEAKGSRDCGKPIGIEGKGGSVGGGERGRGRRQ